MPKAKAKKPTLSSDFPLPATVNIDQVLRAALTSGPDDRPLSTLQELGRRDQGVSDVEILDTLAEEWQDGPYDSEQDGGFCVIGGSVPKFWAGQTQPKGKPTLAGESLAQACRRVADLPDALTAAARGRLEESDTASDETAPEIATNSPETDDELLLRALDSDSEHWSALRSAETVPDGELQEALKTVWKVRKVYDKVEGSPLRAFYARSNPYPAIWMDMPAAVGQPTLATADLRLAVRRVLGLASPAPTAPATTDGIPAGELPIDKIRVVFNDRKEFAEEALQELAASIRQYRVIEPIVVSPPDADGFHTLIAGERRLRAAKIAEHTTIAAVVRAFDPTDTAVVRLTENLLREPLSPIEEAHAYKRLLDGGLTQRALSEKLGVGQPTISSRVGLLRLPESIQAAVNSGDIGPADARLLAGWADRPTVLARFQEQRDWMIDIGADRTVTSMLEYAIENTSRTMVKGKDGPQFKPTGDAKEQLDIVDVKVGKLDGPRAFNVRLWSDLQQKAQQAAAERRSAATTKPVQATLSEHARRYAWGGWFARSVAKRFSGTLKKPETDLLTRLAIVFADEPFANLPDVCFSDEQPTVTRTDAQITRDLIHKSIDDLHAGLRKLFLQRLQHGSTWGMGELPDIIAMAEAAGVTLDEFEPDETLLTKLPEPVVREIADELGTPADLPLPNMIRQLLAEWDTGWVPACLKCVELDGVSI